MKGWRFELTLMVFSVMLQSTVIQINTGRPAGGRRAGPSTCVAALSKMTPAMSRCSARSVLPYASWLKHPSAASCTNLHCIIRQWSVNHGLMDGCMGPLPSDCVSAHCQKKTRFNTNVCAFKDTPSCCHKRNSH